MATVSVRSIVDEVSVVTENGTLCHGDGGHEGGERRRSVLMLPTLYEYGGSLARRHVLNPQMDHGRDKA